MINVYKLLDPDVPQVLKRLEIRKFEREEER